MAPEPTAKYLIIQENGANRTRPAVHGEEITINSPCDSSDISGINIAGTQYRFIDANGDPLPLAGGFFAEGNLIRVLIDTEKNRAQIINRAIMEHPPVDMPMHRRIYAGTQDMTPGSTTLDTGSIYLVYE